MTQEGGSAHARQASGKEPSLTAASADDVPRWNPDVRHDADDDPRLRVSPSTAPSPVRHRMPGRAAGAGLGQERK